MCIVALACAPWIGWWIVPLAVIVIVTLIVLERKMPASSRPEYYSLSSIAVFALVIATVVFGTGGVWSPFAGWLLVPAIMMAARFRPRVVFAGLVTTGLLATTSFIGSYYLVSRERLPAFCAFAAWAALAVGVVAAFMALLNAELSSRGQAMVDPLTGLYNRTALVGRFGQAAEQAGVVSGWLSVIMLDIDHFKAINDTYGHDVGDAVLRGIGEQMRTTPHLADVVYRYGGEEFLILLPSYGAADARAVAERLRAGIAGMTFEGVGVTVSAGVVSGLGGGLVFDDLLRAADQALYAAKEAGRDRICVAG